MANKKTTHRAKARPARKTPPDPRAVREQATVAILKAVPEVIEALIEKAAEGNHLPAKFIFDFAGLTDVPADAESDAIAREVSLAEIFLQKLAETAGDANSGG